MFRYAKSLWWGLGHRAHTSCGFWTNAAPFSSSVHLILAGSLVEGAWGVYPSHQAIRCSGHWLTKDSRKRRTLQRRSEGDLFGHSLRDSRGDLIDMDGALVWHRGPTAVVRLSFRIDIHVIDGENATVQQYNIYNYIRTQYLWQ